MLFCCGSGSTEPAAEEQAVPLLPATSRMRSDRQQEHLEEAGGGEHQRASPSSRPSPDDPPHQRDASSPSSARGGGNGGTTTEPRSQRRSIHDRDDNKSQQHLVRPPSPPSKDHHHHRHHDDDAADGFDGAYSYHDENNNNNNNKLNMTADTADAADSVSTTTSDQERMDAMEEEANYNAANDATAPEEADHVPLQPPATAPAPSSLAPNKVKEERRTANDEYLVETSFHDGAGPTTRRKEDQPPLQLQSTTPTPLPLLPDSDKAKKKERLSTTSASLRIINADASQDLLDETTPVLTATRPVDRGAWTDEVAAPSHHLAASSAAEPARPANNVPSNGPWGFLTGFTSTKNDRYRRISYEHLEQENVMLKGELNRLHHDASHEVNRLRRENDALRAELKVEVRRARQESAYLRQRLEQSERRELEAIHDRRQLLQAIQGVVVDRTVTTVAGRFPAGDELVSRCEEFGDDTVFFFKDLARARCSLVMERADDNDAASLSSSPSAADFSVAVEVVQSLLQDSEVWMKNVANDIVTKKRGQFETFLGRPCQDDNSNNNNNNEPPPSSTAMLVDLLWHGTMQKHIKTLIDNGLNGYFRLSEEHWTESISMYDDGDMRPTSLLGFCKSLLYLELVCRFSHPRCYLFPNIGTTATFDGKRHRQVYIGLDGETRAKEGDAVRVLFPGLYFVHPNNGLEKPNVFALVAQISQDASRVEV
jgi:hypothetical protein